MLCLFQALLGTSLAQASQQPPPSDSWQGATCCQQPAPLQAHWAQVAWVLAQQDSLGVDEARQLWAASTLYWLSQECPLGRATCSRLPPSTVGF